jgi:hypothetical protein
VASEHTLDLVKLGLVTTDVKPMTERGNATRANHHTCNINGVIEIDTVVYI